MGIDEKTDVQIGGFQMSIFLMYFQSIRKRTHLKTSTFIFSSCLIALRNILLVLCCTSVLATAQSVDLSQTVSFQFSNERLEYILSNISQRYQIPIAYSREFIPVNQRISVTVVQVPLEIGLKELFAPTKVVYAVIGNSVVLRVDETKEIYQSEITLTSQEIPSEKVEIPAKKIVRNYTKIAILRKESYALLNKPRLIDTEVLDALKNLAVVERTIIPNLYEDSPYREMSQVTLVPTISTNQELADSITNTFSLNIIYGINGGVEGIEVGGFGNRIQNNMKGLQIASLFNDVKGTMSGTQFAGLVNQNEGYTRGLQFTLGVNITNETKAVQMAGLMNMAKGDFAGLQMALICNYIRTKGEGVQIAGIYNKAKSYVQSQYSLFHNKGGEIEKVQVGLVNKANFVKGNQYGLINIADEVRGTSIGLFNFIKKGYNRIEFAGGESLFTNFGFKFGKRNFYNILHFGYRFTNDVWSLGYGIGTGIAIQKNQHVHLEWVISHVNEGDWWTKNKNWLHQLKGSYDLAIGENNTSLFIGPTLNWSISTIRPSEMEAFTGSTLPSYTFLNTNKIRANWKMWFGATAGLRF